MADGEVFGATVGMPVVVDRVVSGVDYFGRSAAIRTLREVVC